MLSFSPCSTDAAPSLWPGSLPDIPPQLAQEYLIAVPFVLVAGAHPLAQIPGSIPQVASLSTCSSSCPGSLKAVGGSLFWSAFAEYMAVGPLRRQSTPSWCADRTRLGQHAEDGVLGRPRQRCPY